MSFLLSRRSGTKSLVGTRIQLLTSQQKALSEKDCSPTLKDLREKEKNRVKKFSDIFERQAWCLTGSGCNWWLNQTETSSPQVPKSSTPKKSGRFVYPTPPPPSAPSRTAFAKSKIDDGIKLKKLLRMEEDFVEKLRKLIDSLEGIDCGVFGYKETKIRENRFCLFGDLKAILSLHVDTIVPEMSKIIETKGKCIDFIQFLGKLVDDGLFYCYVSHKMMEKSSKKFHNDLGGPNSLFNDHKMNPLKMLEVYHEWISNVCNELIKRPTENSDNIAACMETENTLTELMDKIADAENVQFITQVSEVPVEAQFKIFNIIKRNKHIENITSPMLLLVPQKHKMNGYRCPVSY
jgi:hypothetical protein